MPKSSTNYRIKIHVSVNYNKILVIEALVRRRVQNLSMTSYNQYNDSEILHHPSFVILS